MLICTHCAESLTVTATYFLPLFLFLSHSLPLTHTYFYLFVFFQSYNLSRCKKNHFKSFYFIFQNLEYFVQIWLSVTIGLDHSAIRQLQNFFPSKTLPSLKVSVLCYNKNTLICFSHFQRKCNFLEILKLI